MQVYEGMVVGEHSRDGDLEINPVREKKLTNVRAAGADDKVFLTPPRQVCSRAVLRCAVSILSAAGSPTCALQVLIALTDSRCCAGN